MKKFNWLMMLVATAALSFAACTKANTEEPKPGPEPGPGPDVETLTFAVEVGEVTASSVSFTVTPSDLEAEYLCVLYDAETVEEFTKDEYLIATLFQELEAEARTTGKTLAEFMPEVVDKVNVAFTGAVDKIVAKRDKKKCEKQQNSEEQKDAYVDIAE